MAELKSLTLGGNTYDSFVDKQAREDIDAAAKNVFFINIITDSNLSEESGRIISTLDVTFLELQEAYLAGKIVAMKVSSDGCTVLLYLVEYLEDAFSFSCRTEDPNRIFFATVSSSSDVEISWSKAESASGQSGSLIVTASGGVANYGSDEIYSHVQDGETVVFALDGGDYINLAFCNEDMASFLYASIEENLFDEYVIYQDGSVEIFSRTNADMDNIPTDTHINSLIDAKLGVIENGSY